MNPTIQTVNPDGSVVFSTNTSETIPLNDLTELISQLVAQITADQAKLAIYQVALTQAQNAVNANVPPPTNT